ncbi:hypothetical protein [Photobacterium kishitanii]|uniref:Polysaccharide chain length determinant N-terminal domain-containing protein n=1 Tax=Photobacterium kishitanii TaxID=318456 RepID=A0A2T3KA25_9GAMM|nr:hypothetical protein [Photobacterium kishitanii]PSU87996.1 hypothetical protein C9J27_25810 [Photobacterium kishitanii]
MLSQEKEIGNFFRRGLSSRVVIGVSLFIFLFIYVVKNIQSHDLWQTRLNITPNTISYNISDFFYNGSDNKLINSTQDYKNLFNDIDNEYLYGLFVRELEKSHYSGVGDIKFRLAPLTLMSNAESKNESKENLDKYLLMIENKVKNEINKNIEIKNKKYLKIINDNINKVKHKANIELSLKLFELNSAIGIAKSLNIENPVYNFNGKSIFPFYLGVKVLSEEIKILKSERALNIYYPQIKQYKNMVSELKQLKINTSNVKIIKISNIDVLYKPRFSLFSTIMYSLFGFIFGFLINLIYSLKRNDYK